MTHTKVQQPTNSILIMSGDVTDFKNFTLALREYR